MSSGCTSFFPSASRTCLLNFVIFFQVTDNCLLGFLSFFLVCSFLSFPFEERDRFNVMGKIFQDPEWTSIMFAKPEDKLPGCKEPGVLGGVLQWVWVSCLSTLHWKRDHYRFEVSHGRWWVIKLRETAHQLSCTEDGVHFLQMCSPSCPKSRQSVWNALIALGGNNCLPFAGTWFPLPEESVWRSYFQRTVQSEIINCRATLATLEVSLLSQLSFWCVSLLIRHIFV